MAKRRSSSAVKIKKKKWFPIYATAQFNNVLLGETYIHDESELATKYLTANLSTITRSMRKQNINVQFKVDRVEEGKAYTKIIGYSMINAAIKRLVRRGRDKIADSFLAKTKDKDVIRIKPLIVTGNKGTKALQSAIRLEARRIIREFVFTKTLPEVFAEIVDGKLQKQIKTAVAKLSPVRSCEIRMAKIDENTKVVVTDDGVKTEKVTIRRREKGNQLETATSVIQADEVSVNEDDLIVANESEFDENATVEEELAQATEVELDEEDEVMVTDKVAVESETLSESDVEVKVVDESDKKKE